MATIKDVARLAGVAPSTVSNYFTGNANVSEETRTRIEKAIKELGYRPNIAARSLRLSQSKSIGLVVPNIANPYFSEIVQAIGLACQPLGYSLLLSASNGDDSRETELVNNLFKQHIDGLLIIHTGRDRQELPFADDPPLPVVFVDREVVGCASVATDNYLGGRMAAQHLVRLGHRHIGILAGDIHVRNVQQRVEGFQDELARYGLSVDPNLVIKGTQSFETGRDVHLLMVQSKPPTAIFATNDIIALGAWHKLTTMGYRVPEDVSIVGFDNIEMSQWTIPPLTTVHQDKRELGRQAVALLVKTIQSRIPFSETIYVPPEIVVRGSSAPPPSTLES